jgi:hypothetical protein
MKMHLSLYLAGKPTIIVLLTYLILLHTKAVPFKKCKDSLTVFHNDTRVLEIEKSDLILENTPCPWGGNVCQCHLGKKYEKENKKKREYLKLKQRKRQR